MKQTATIYNFIREFCERRSSADVEDMDQRLQHPQFIAQLERQIDVERTMKR